MFPTTTAEVQVPEAREDEREQCGDGRRFVLHDPHLRFTPCESFASVPGMQARFTLPDDIQTARSITRATARRSERRPRSMAT